MIEKDKICTISGLRPYKLPKGFDYHALIQKIETEIRKSIMLGYTGFQTGMAMGVDIWAAEIIIKLKLEFPEVRLICLLPCETQADRWPNNWRERYFEALSKADDVIYVQTHYTDGCAQRRNRSMIDGSSRLIAVHDGVFAGGTAQTIRYAKACGLDVVVIDPFERRQTLARPLVTAE